MVPLVKCSSAWSCGSVGGMAKSALCGLDQAVPVERVPSVARFPVFGNQDHVFQRRQLRPDRRHLAAVERLGGHQHAAFADAEPRRQRLGAEGGEQRRDDAFRLQRAEHGDVEFGNAAGQHEDALARRTPSWRRALANRLVSACRSR